VNSVAKNSTDFKVVYTARFEIDHPFLVFIFDPKTKRILSMDGMLTPAQ
jgi:serine protease inhibitor